MAILNEVVKLCRKTFDKANKSRFDENLAKLLSMANRLTLSDIHIDQSVIQNHDDAPTFSGGNPLLYMHIYKDKNVRLTVFILKSDSTIDLHDHPQMYGILKVLSGALRVQSYSVDEKYLKNLKKKRAGVTALSASSISTRSSSMVGTCSSNNSRSNSGKKSSYRMNTRSCTAKSGNSNYVSEIFSDTESSDEEEDFYPYTIMPLPAKKHASQIVTVDGFCDILTPTDNNIHGIHSVGGPSAFLEIISPPFKTPLYHQLGPTRACTYFREIEIEDDDAILSPMFGGPDFWVVDIIYDGPRIVV